MDNDPKKIIQCLDSELNDLLNEEDQEQSQYYNNLIAQIEKDLTTMKAIKDDLSKMREVTAALEWKMVSRVSSATWKEIAELIGLSSNTGLADCFNVFDQCLQESS